MLISINRCYGIDCVMDLSGNDPSSAVNNADSKYN